jgi:acetylornithine deacetylase/succinyl-diaminopimelate desuccinylase-like protein
MMVKDQVLQKLFDMADEATDELVELQQELVRIPSINTGAPDSGNETEVCRSLEQRFNAEGIPNITLESAPGRGNFIAHIGEKDSPRLMLMTHNDVVPIEDESKWDFPPFSGQIVDGKVYGRGSDDCKSITSSSAMAMILFNRAGISLNGELRFLAAADEESGGNYGIQWLAENHPEKIRADWAVNEAGGIPQKTVNGQQAYLFSIGEKGRIEARFNLAGRSAHGARPWYADNALYKMAELLKRLRKYQDEAEIDLNVPIFEQMHLFGIEGKVAPEKIDQLLNELEGSSQALARDLKGMSRISVTPTITAAGAKSNSIPSKATLICDVRTLPNQDEAYVRQELDKLIDGIEGISYELDVWAISNSSPADSPFVDIMKRATELVLNQEILMVPSITIGFTDSRCVRPFGTEVYGFSPLTPDSDVTRTGIHGINEAMEISNLVFRTKIQIALAYMALKGVMA